MESFLPIFPLNTVFFPGNTLEIQIFEERYKKMFSNVLQSNLEMGIFCIKEGFEAYGPLPIPYSIGTLARIFDYQIIPTLESEVDKEYIIRVVLMGIKKIKLLYEYESQEHYWIGNVIPCEENYNTSSIQKEERELFYNELKKFLESQNFFEWDQLDQDNLVFLCHFALKYISIPLEEKQKLLETSNFLDRWKKTLQILKEKNQIIDQLKNIQKPENRLDEFN